jgi:hypothetical protein
MKTLLYIFLLTVFFTKAQTPQTINYQGVARDVVGLPLINTNIGLVFKISTASNTSFYTETQSSVATNSLGLFSTQIGIVNPLPTSGWENTPCVLSILANFGSGYVSLPSQTLASVPYALYALNAGNALPVGSRDGQTLRWDSIAKVWKTSNLLTNDEQRVGIGLFPYEIGSKLHVTSKTNNDSSAISAIKLNANGNDVAFKSSVFGSSYGATFNSTLFGSKNIAKNIGNALAIGSYNFAESNGDAIGLYGEAQTNSTAKTAVGVYGKLDNASVGTAIGVIGVGGTVNNATAIGIYGTTDSTSTASNKFAGVFENGDLLLKNGHLSANGTATNTTFAVATNFLLSGNIPTTYKLAGSNDVSGRVKLAFISPLSFTFSQYVTIQIPFDKAYLNKPYVFIQATNPEASRIAYFISSTNTSYFEVKFVNANSTVTLSTLDFNYFVIE